MERNKAEVVAKNTKGKKMAVPMYFKNPSDNNRFTEPHITPPPKVPALMGWHDWEGPLPVSSPCSLIY